jgi:acyl-CoA reductase-like NAD-dependent aldehyde dehydrogenase
VLAALRAGVRRVRFEGSAEAASHLGEIAAQYGATIERGAHAPALDLLDAADPEAACRAYLAGNSAGA